jgi:2-dehydropantoate 2-reductase
MKILVIGAGALGSLLGGLLSKEHEVTIIGRPEQVWVLKRKGLKIDGITKGDFRPNALTGVPKDERFDLVILCVKSYNTEVTLEPLSEVLKSGARILSLQNGLDNEERILRFLNENSISSEVIGGITCHGVTYKGPGVIKHAGTGDTIIGHFASSSEESTSESLVNEIAEVFTHVGFEMGTTTCIDREIWAKTIINSAINPLTAILNGPNGIILSNPEVMSTADDIIKEGVRIANAYGKNLTIEEMRKRTFDVAERTKRNRSSMLQDIQRKRRTEVDSINGAIHEKALEKGLEAPLNRTMVRLIKALEDRNLEDKPSSEEG